MKLLKKTYRVFKTALMYVMICAGVILLVFQSVYIYKAYRTTSLFDLKNIVVHNNITLSGNDVMRMSGIDKGTRIMEINKKYVAEKLISNPEIDHASVKIIYPATVVIHIRETIPIAVLNNQNTLKYVGSKGDILSGDRPSDYDLPIIVGDFDQKIIQFLNSTLRISPLVYHRISEIKSSENGIELFLINNSAHVVVGKEDYDKRIIVLDNFLKEEYGTVSFSQVEYIDLRFDRKVVLKEFAMAR